MKTALMKAGHVAARTAILFATLVAGAHATDAWIVKWPVVATLPKTLYGSPVAACQDPIITDYAGPTWSVFVKAQEDPAVVAPNQACYYATVNGGLWLVAHVGPPVCSSTESFDYSSAVCMLRASEAASAAKKSGVSCPSLNNPIALGSGNKFLTQTDSVSGAVVFSRTYNSLSTRIGYPELITGSSSGVMSLGIGWTSDYQQQIRLPSGSSTTAWSIRAGGRVLTFQLSGSTWNAEADVSDRLIELKNSAGVRTGWRYLDAAEERAETFDASGKLESVRERDGTVRTVIYSDGTDGSVSGKGGFVLDASGNPTTTVLPAGRLLRVQDSQGQTLTFGHDASGRIVKVTNSAGQSVRYGHDAANQLTTVTYPDSTVRTYHYNEAAHTGGANLPGALTSITDENGARFATYRRAAAQLYLGRRYPARHRRAHPAGRWNL